MHKKLGLLVALVLFMGLHGYGQSYSTPFSGFGIGEKVDFTLPHNLGMANVGISNGDIRYINIANPALLTNNAVYTFSAGMVGGNAKLSNGSITEKTGGANLSHLAMSFPIIPNKWTSAIIMKPYSFRSYNYTSEGPVNGTTTNSVEEVVGLGGLNTITWANGVKINENLSIGLKMNYFFSSLTEEVRLSLNDPNVSNLYTIVGVERDAISGLALGGGLGYSQAINKDVKLNFGLTYDLATDLDDKKFETEERRFFDNGNAIDVDTLFNETTGTMTLPAELGFGVSLVDALKWSAGLDIRMQDWSDYSNFEDSNEGLDRGIKIGIGGEYTPDAGDINKFLKRVTYRIGFSYENTPYVINGEDVKDLGINFGWSVPISNISSIDMGFKYGTRGNISKVGLKENYFKFQLGLTFNDRLWFIKRKFD